MKDAGSVYESVIAGSVIVVSTGRICISPINNGKISQIAINGSNTQEEQSKVVSLGGLSIAEYFDKQSMDDESNEP